MAITEQKIDKRMAELKKEFAVEKDTISKAREVIDVSTSNLIALQGEYRGLRRLKEENGRPNTKKLKTKKK